MTGAGTKQGLKSHAIIVGGLCIGLLMPACKQQSTNSAAKGADPSAVRAGAVTEQDLGGLAGLRDQFLTQAVSRAGLHTFLENLAVKLTSGQEAVTPEEVFVGSQMLLLRPFRSAIYRITPLLQHYNGTHSILLTVQQQISSTVNIFLPTPQWQAVMDYVTQPDDANTPQFQSLAEIQNEAEKTVGEALAFAIDRISKLPLTDAKPYVWDGRFGYGPASFKDNRDRFAKIGVAEKWHVLGALERSLLTLRLGCAYNVDDGLAVSANVGKLVGVDGFFGEVEGAPMSSRVGVITDAGSYPNFLTLRTVNGAAGVEQKGKDLMTAALKNLQNSADDAVEEWKAIQARSAALAGQVDEWWVLNPALFMANSRVIDQAVNEGHDIAFKATAVSSMLTGEVTQVNVPQFFTNPPADLRTFFPVSFVVDKNITAQGVSIHNYLYGAPLTWNPAAFAPYLPGVQGPADVKNVARILSESRGGSLVAGAIASVVN